MLKTFYVSEMKKYTEGKFRLQTKLRAATSGKPRKWILRKRLHANIWHNLMSYLKRDISFALTSPTLVLESSSSYWDVRKSISHSYSQPTRR
ncbi:hypothetical protein PNOK_0957600 [Pyrrhoderma noxium]|uniref:Uncharacterized protein n=1 Tax=Pyrrhoderma noxium TaxID=2282107 RepID=A0A286U631_9AGAM|nr:hypothetical protein PNOK_0957600 [Pyrrhoderma noxium]